MGDLLVAGRELEEWKEELRIDTDSLDQEIERHPYLFYQVASACVQASSERDERYDAVKHRDAELNFEVREQLANDGYRVTEEQVKSAVQKHPDHSSRYSSYLDKKLEADQLEALRNAFQQRGYMLRDLVQLYTTGYMTNTSVGGGASYKRNSAGEEPNRQRLREVLGRNAGKEE